MKHFAKFFLVSLMLLTVIALKAQWNGTNPLWTNSSVGIGTSTPKAIIDLGYLNYVAGAPRLLIYDDNSTTGFTGTKVGFYVDNFPGGNNVNFVFPEAASYPGLFTISAKNTSGTTLNPYLSVVGLTGNVGIGMTNPSYKFHVSSTTNGWASVVQNQGCYVYSAYGNGTSDGYGMHIRVNNSRSDRYALQIYNGTNYLLNVLNNGQVGIATTSNNAQLNIKTSNSSIYGVEIDHTIGGNYSYGMRILTNNELSKAFSVINGGNEVFRIMGSGVVDAKTIYAEAFSVRTDAMNITWPDYVLKSNYKLISISDVEKYIKTNKHLPDLPSQDEVKTGYNLVEMDAKLLKKIEELTLYVIELKKENESLKQQMNNLKNK